MVFVDIVNFDQNGTKDAAKYEYTIANSLHVDEISTVNWDVNSSKCKDIVMENVGNRYEF